MNEPLITLQNELMNFAMFQNPYEKCSKQRFSSRSLKQNSIGLEQTKTKFLSHTQAKPLERIANFIIALGLDVFANSVSFHESLRIA